MRILAIETATAACSVALFEDGTLYAHAHEMVGRGHAERLIPMIGELPDKGRADLILVDCGPGSFTGVRVGLAAALGLGLGWKVPVQGFSSLALIAAGAWPDDTPTLAVAINGGHGQIFVQSFAAGPMRPLSDLVSLTPEAAGESVVENLVIGSGAAALVEARGSGMALDATIDAKNALLIAHDLRAARAAPLYGRAPDARPSAQAVP